jgi:hypothetical protein
MANDCNWKKLAGHQFQVVNEQIIECHKEIRQGENDPKQQQLLEKALGALSLAWEIVDSSHQMQ